MRSFIVCFSLYLLLLVAYPCHCNLLEVAPSAALELSMDYTNDNAPLDICSPLCACSSSENPLIVKYPTIFNQVKLVIYKPLYINYDEQLQDAYLSTLKAPPKQLV